MIYFHTGMLAALLYLALYTGIKVDKLVDRAYDVQVVEYDDQEDDETLPCPDGTEPTDWCECEVPSYGTDC